MSDDVRAYYTARLTYLRVQYQALARLALADARTQYRTVAHYKVELRRIAGFIEEIRRSPVMTRNMYDSTDPTIIPTSAQIVAYYPHAWGTDVSGHKDALVVSIDNTGAHADDCHILDVESGAASNATAAEWIQSWHKLHPSGLDCMNGHIAKPVIYTSTSNLPALRGATSGLLYDTWAAQWDGNTTPVAGCFAKQYADHGPNGENYDMSVVFDDLWGKTQSAPAPTPKPPASSTPAPIQGLVTWADNSWAGHARLVTSDDGGHTWK
jgi:hypothetical protein